ncbi:uncharacterized protein LOC121258832 [Juglans microcarpa x Juglans regia]|uniref:uncharacterized protein LOC121258832 n=1 Tax=Juglans microcarpa x Juglans regia TaxID=2249226 RepID=UPI001B7E5F39|nr:uncharacterized protein LOC121258832 [Juglans microcarpa x Juglans regia]
MRRIWLRRNNLLFNKKFYSPKSLIQLASEGLEDYKTAQLISISRTVSGALDGSKKKWQKPNPGVVKANWDASLDLHAKKMGVGICIRDEEGEVLVSACDVRAHVDNPARAECMALWKSLEICKELVLLKVSFEGDAAAAAVINAISKDGEDQSWMGHIIEDIKRIITEREDWTVNFVPREGNCVAHLLDKHALVLGEERVWIEEGPYVICNVLLQDKFCNVSG